MNEKEISSGKRWVRRIFAILSWLFIMGVLIQVFLAGIALFVDFGQWNYHKSFIHYFEFIPVIMLILAFFGAIPNRLRWESLAMYVMIILQYVTVSLAGKIPYLSALHPIIALILFWRALVSVQTSAKLLKK